MPHTARAIIALSHADHSDHGTGRAIDEAVRWLIEKRDLTNQTEHMRRGYPNFVKSHSS